MTDVHSSQSRTHATSPVHTERTTLRFLLEAVEGFLLAPAVLISWPLSRRWLDNWGASPAERDGHRVGDDLAPDAAHTSTRAVSVRASADDVWRWVVQFGLGRAGFYSYELIERMVGIPVRNVESILPRHQSLQIGDEIKLHPNTPGIPVGAVEAGRCVCFGQSGPIDETTPDPRRSWSVYIDPTSPRSCRLILRSCVEPLRDPTFALRIGLAVEGPVDFVMEQRMLRTIRRLAESASSP